jgi:hypothetical protein
MTEFTDPTPLVAKRQTISFTPQANTAMEWQLGNTPARNASDAVCRSLTINTFVQQAIAAGKDILLRDKNGEIETVRIL